MKTFTFYIIGETINSQDKDGIYYIPDPKNAPSYISACLHFDQKYRGFLNKETAKNVIKQRNGVRPFFEFTLDGIDETHIKGCEKTVAMLNGKAIEHYVINLPEVENLKFVQATLDHVDPVKFPKPFTELESLQTKLKLSQMPKRWMNAFAEFEKERKKREETPTPKLEPKEDKAITILRKIAVNKREYDSVSSDSESTNEKKKRRTKEK